MTFPFPTPLSFSLPSSPPPSFYSSYHYLFDDFAPLYTSNPSIDNFMPPQHRHPSSAAANNNFPALPHAGININTNNNNNFLSHDDNGSINIDDFIDDSSINTNSYNFPISPEAEAEIFEAGINSSGVPSTNDDYISVDAYGNAVAVAGDWRRNLPPGVRFRPTDGELITYYLKPNFGNQSFDDNQPVIYREIYHYEPHQLFEMGEDHGDGRRYFYTRVKKIGASKTDRSIKGNKGNWKATQKGVAIKDENEIEIGWKTPLAYFDKNKKKTQWLMQEYKLQQEYYHSHQQLVLAVVYYFPSHNNN